MFQKTDLDRARKTQCVAARLSYLADAIELHMLMDTLCLKALEIGMHTGHDDNNDFSYYEIDSVHFDEEKLTAKGGTEYLVSVLAEQFKCIVGEHYELEQIKDFVDSPDFLQEGEIRDMDCDLGDVVRFNGHEERIDFEALSQRIKTCLADDAARIVADLAGMAA